MTPDIFDAIVIGAGSGGSAFAKRAAGHGASVAIIEGADFGGTCVNVGCVPKKIMWWASQVQEFVDHAGEYGLKVKRDGPIDWAHLKSRRDASVKRLRKVYEDGLLASGVCCFKGTASFATSSESADDGVVRTRAIEVSKTDGSKQILLGKHIVIATGSESTKLGVPGESECTAGSDFLFAMEQLPKKIAIIGAGYIAVEFAGLLRGLGSEVSLFIRGNQVLRKFDTLITSSVTKNLEKQGVIINRNSVIKKFSMDEGGRYVELDNSETKFGPYDYIIVAVGRTPNLASLRLDTLEPAIEKLESGGLRVDDFQNTSLPGIYAIGDIIQKVELTPMAIAAGRRLADRLFLRGYSQASVSYKNVPSVIFSHPPVGSVGMSEADAKLRFGSKVLIYTNTAINLYYNVFDQPAESKPRILVKIVCITAGADEIVVGIHVIGMGADEIIQGFGLAIGATKAHLDTIVAVHPSAAEELVTCQPWGLPHPESGNLRQPTTSVGGESEPKESVGVLQGSA